MNLILFGFKACGKTFIGKQIAAQLGSTFLDTDELIEMLYAKEQCESLSCREIVLERGEFFFRLLEKRVIRELNVQNAVISVGGGAVLQRVNLQKLLSLGKLIYLECDKETLKKRLLTPPLPSFLQTDDPEGSFERMYHTRLSYYEKIPAVKIGATPLKLDFDRKYFLA